jgi:hypothetical protein
LIDGQTDQQNFHYNGKNKNEITATKLFRMVNEPTSIIRNVKSMELIYNVSRATQK